MRTIQEEIRDAWEYCEDGTIPWDVLIVATRYGGVYEGAAWLAFPWEPDLDEVRGSDGTCREWFADRKLAPIGRGDDPSAALAHLKEIAAMGREAWETAQAK